MHRITTRAWHTHRSQEANVSSVSYITFLGANTVYTINEPVWLTCLTLEHLLLVNTYVTRLFELVAGATNSRGHKVFS